MIKKRHYIEIAAELEIIENKLKLLDDTNPIDQTSISLLLSRLLTVSLKLKKYKRMNRFKLIGGGSSDQ